jgi:hypothetical protein
MSAKTGLASAIERGIHSRSRSRSYPFELLDPLPELDPLPDPWPEPEPCPLPELEFFTRLRMPRTV